MTHAPTAAKDWATSWFPLPIPADTALNAQASETACSVVLQTLTIVLSANEATSPRPTAPALHATPIVPHVSEISPALVVSTDGPSKNMLPQEPAYNAETLVRLAQALPITAHLAPRVTLESIRNAEGTAMSSSELSSVSPSPLPTATSRLSWSPSSFS